MNIIVDKLPETLAVLGKKYEINTDYKPCIRTILAFEDSDLAMSEKVAILLTNIYRTIPKGHKEMARQAVKQAIWFLNGGKEEADEGDESNPRLYSFSKDSGFIFAAFRQTHGIDLVETEMHWWKFLNLFLDLGADTAFCQLVGLRKRVKTGKATKEERRAAREMGDLFDVPELEMTTLDERERKANFLRLVEQGRKK